MTTLAKRPWSGTCIRVEPGTSSLKETASESSMKQNLVEEHNTAVLIEINIDLKYVDEHLNMGEHNQAEQCKCS